MPDAFEQTFRKALVTPGAKNAFLSKHLNVWVNADVAWMDMTRWYAGGDSALCEEDFLGERCWLGLDIASKIDITALVKVFRREIDGATHFYLFMNTWLPEQTIQTSSNSQYRAWAEQGFICQTPGARTDYAAIEAEIDRANENFAVVSLAFDPWQGGMISSRCEEKGIATIEVGQGTKSMSDPSKELDALVRDGRLHHNNNPVLTWMVNNVVCHVDLNENIKPNKPANSLQKIDGAIAGIMALKCALADPGPVSSFAPFII